MIDLIKASAVPANLVQSASKGALALPANETIEILVYLATQSKVFGEQARMTLAGWDEKSTAAVAGSAETPPEVLAYLTDRRNLRRALLPALTENLAVSDLALAELARSAVPEVLDVFINSERSRASAIIVEALKANLNLKPAQRALLHASIDQSGKKAAADPKSSAQPGAGVETAPANGEAHEEPDTPEVIAAVNAFLTEHAAELTAEAEKPFQPIGGITEELSVDAGAGSTAAAAPAAQPEAKPSGHPAKAPAETEKKRESTLQKIAKLDISGRIQLAMKGTKEERNLLIRDGTKLVALAVLESPKISDGEVEKIASQKNVLETVLRAIPMKRRFAKNYMIMRNLVFNPRVPIDLALTLMKNMLIGDLKALSGNKEVSETIRKLALRMYKQKIEKKD
jgi:hypothetical protein